MLGKNQYSKFIILVFNIGDSRSLSQQEKNILASVKNKWAATHAQSIDIIFVHPSDILIQSPHDKFTDEKAFPYNPKFKPLTEIDEKSLLWCVGHHYLNNELSTTNGQKFRHWEFIESVDSDNDEHYFFPYSAIGQLLFSYIKNSRVLAKRKNFIYPIHPHRFKIVVSPCNSGVGTFSDHKENLTESLSGRLFDFLSNNHKDKYLNCEVWGERGYLFPTPGKPSFINFIKLLLGKTDSLRDWFHKRYFYVQNNKLSTLIPAHQPKDRKICFEMDPATTSSDVLNSKIKPKIQTIEQKTPTPNNKNQTFFIKRIFLNIYHYFFNMTAFFSKKYETLLDKLHHLKVQSSSTSKKLAHFFHVNHAKVNPINKKEQEIEQRASLFASRVDKKLNIEQYHDIATTIKHRAQSLPKVEKVKKITNALEYNFNNESFDANHLTRQKLNEIAATTNSGFPHFSGNCVLLSRCLLYNLKTGRNLLAAKNTHPIFTNPFLGWVSQKYTEMMLFSQRLKKVQVIFHSIDEVKSSLLDIFKIEGERLFIIHAQGHVFPIVGEINHSFNAVIIGDGDNAKVQFVDAWKTLDRLPSAEKIQHEQEGATFQILYHPDTPQHEEEPQPNSSIKHPSPSLNR